MASPICFQMFFSALLSTSIRGALADAKSQATEDQSEILNCIKSVASYQHLEYFDITGDNGFKLLHHNNTKQQVVVGGRLGKGRLIGAGNDAFFQPEAESERSSDRIKFFSNLFNWVTGGNTTKAAIYQGNSIVNEPTRKTLARFFQQVVTLKKHTEFKTTDANVLLLNAVSLAQPEAPALKDAVTKGLGLVLAVTTWSDYNRYKKDFKSLYPANIVTAQAGFVARGSGFDPTGDFDNSAEPMTSKSLTPALTKCKPLPM